MTDVLYRFANISPDELYRYKLVRTLSEEGRTALWIGVNPSTADGEIDDASIRKLYGFGQRLGIGTWLVGNMFAYRSTDVRQLAQAPDPVGPYCDMYLEEMMTEADIIIAGWGSIGKVPRRLRYRWDQVLFMAEEAGKQLMCWGTCSDGHPRHPLMLTYSTELVPWKPMPCP